MLIASSVNGFLFGFVSGQPLLILGPTGPFLVFEEMVYDVRIERVDACGSAVPLLLFQLCQSLQADFWTVRCCVSLWTTFFIILLVAFEGSFMIRHVTRFTEEIFALIIALVYLYEPFKKVYKVNSRTASSSRQRCTKMSQIFRSNPVRSKYTYDYPLACLCNMSSRLNASLLIDELHPSSENFSMPLPSKYSCYNCVSTSSSLRNSTVILSHDENQLPNKALLSLIILLGTCFIAVALKLFRRSHFFGRSVSRSHSGAMRECWRLRIVFPTSSRRSDFPDGEREKNRSTVSATDGSKRAAVERSIEFAYRIEPSADHRKTPLSYRT